jgi:hypothetical protein
MAVFTVKTTRPSYTLRRDAQQPEELRTKYVFRIFSAKLRAFIEEGMVTVVGPNAAKITQASGTLNALKYGIAEIHNQIVDREGGERTVVNISTKDKKSPYLEGGHFGLRVLRDSVIDWLDPDKYELFNAMMEANGVKGDEDEPGTDLGNLPSSPNSHAGESGGEPVVGE